MNTSSCLDEIVHIEAWASENNLKLNCAKSKEIIIFCARKRWPVDTDAVTVYEH